MSPFWFNVFNDELTAPLGWDPFTRPVIGSSIHCVVKFWTLFLKTGVVSVMSNCKPPPWERPFFSQGISDCTVPPLSSMWLSTTRISRQNYFLSWSIRSSIICKPLNRRTFGLLYSSSVEKIASIANLWSFLNQPTLLMTEIQISSSLDTIHFQFPKYTFLLPLFPKQVDHSVAIAIFNSRDWNYNFHFMIIALELLASTPAVVIPPLLIFYVQALNYCLLLSPAFTSLRMANTIFHCFKSWGTKSIDLLRPTIYLNWPRHKCTSAIWGPCAYSRPYSDLHLSLYPNISNCLLSSLQSQSSHPPPNVPATTAHPPEDTNFGTTNQSTGAISANSWLLIRGMIVSPRLLKWWTFLLWTFPNPHTRNSQMIRPRM